MRIRESVESGRRCTIGVGRIAALATRPSNLLPLLVGLLGCDQWKSKLFFVFFIVVPRGTTGVQFQSTRTERQHLASDIHVVDEIAVAKSGHMTADIARPGFICAERPLECPWCRMADAMMRIVTRRMQSTRRIEKKARPVRMSFPLQ